MGGGIGDIKLGGRGYLYGGGGGWEHNGVGEGDST